MSEGFASAMAQISILIAVGLAVEVAYLVRRLQAQADREMRWALEVTRVRDELPRSNPIEEPSAPESSSDLDIGPPLPRVSRHLRRARLRSKLVTLAASCVYTFVALWLVWVMKSCLKYLAGGHADIGTGLITDSAMAGACMLVGLPAILALSALSKSIDLTDKVVNVPSFGRALRRMPEVEEAPPGP